MASLSEKSDGSIKERDSRDGNTECTVGALSKEAAIKPVMPRPTPLIRSTSRGSFAFDAEAQRTSEEFEQNPSPVKVPRSDRRGLLGKLTVLAEVEEPKHYPNSVKWFITFVIALAAVAAPAGSTILLPCLPEIAVDLNASTSITNLSVAFYMLSLAFFPLFWSSFCETFGRRSIYLISFLLYVLFNVLSAISTNIAMLIIMRVLSGGASGSVQSVGAGTLSDIWHVRERGRAMGIFYLGPLMGPLLAPILGGTLQLRWGWRSTMWFLTIYAVITLSLLAWCLPETLKVRTPLATMVTPDGAPMERPVAARGSLHVKSKKALVLLKRIFLDPFRVMYYLRFPAVAIVVYWASITFGALYVLQISVQATFGQPPYNFTSLELGLAYLSNSLGYMIASIFGGKWTDRIMAREARKANRYDEHGRLIYRPEDRMRENAWLAALMYPAALIWYGWTAKYHVHWIVPLIANLFFGFGSMLVFGMATTMLTEFMPKKTSSGVALNNFCRNIFSSVGGVIAQPLISAIGDGWLFTGLGVIAACSSVVVVWSMRHYGPRWRKAMDEKLDDARTT